MYDPTAESLTKYWRASFTASPWVGTASVGASGSSNLTEATNPPTAGAAVNGYTPAVFNGTTSVLNDGTLASAIGDGTDFKIWALVKPNSLAADPGYAGRFNSPQVFCDADAYFAAFITDAGFGAWVADGVGTPSDVVKPVVTGQWQLMTFAYSAGTISVDVDDSGSPATQAYAVAGGLAAATVVGARYDKTTSLDADILEIGIGPSSIQDSDLIEYINDRYGLSL